MGRPSSYKKRDRVVFPVGDRATFNGTIVHTFGEPGETPIQEAVPKWAEWVSVRKGDDFMRFHKTKP